MNKNEIIIITTLLVLIIGGLLLSLKKEISIPAPSPSVSPTPDKDQKYIDLMTAKCYNEEEVEVSCKG